MKQNDFLINRKLLQILFIKGVFVIKILFYDTKSYDKESFLNALEKYPQISADFLKTDISPKTVTLAKGYDAVCVFVASDVNAEIIQRLKTLGVKLILLRCAGFNNVDLKSAKECGITVMRVPAYSPEAVAEHALALAFCTNRHIHKAYIKVRENNFSLIGLTGFNFSGKTAGIIGTGKIGTAMCRFCKGLNMKVVAYDKTENPQLDFVEYMSLDKLLGISDLISLHCPYTAETHHIIDLSAIEKMKDNVILVNTSRGALISTDDLIKGIRMHKFAGVGLDVYEEEGDNVFENREGDILETSVTARLLSFPNVVITSHQGFLTHEALLAISDTTLLNAISFSNGKPIQENTVSV